MFVLTAIKRPPIPEVDLAFAVSAASRDSSEIYRQCKAIVKSVVDTYGMDKVKIALIVYGSTPSTKITFQEASSFPTDENLKGYIDNLPASSGEPNLEKALRRAEDLFSNGGRPSAKKILAVISDKRFVGPKCFFFQPICTSRPHFQNQELQERKLLYFSFFFAMHSV
jgi:hypothetical protein